MATQSHAVAHHRAASTCGGRRHGLDSRHNPTIPSAKASHGDTHLLNQSASRAAIYSDPFRNPPCSRPLKAGFQPWFSPSRRPYPEPSVFADGRWSMPIAPTRLSELPLRCGGQPVRARRSVRARS